MWFLISSYVVLYFSFVDYVSGFPVSEINNMNLVRHKRDNFLFDTDSVLWRERRGDSSNKDTKDSSNKGQEEAWNEKQESIQKLKQLEELRGESLEEENGYNSFKQKWISSWSNGPIERRLHSLSIGPRNRFGFPLSLPLPGRSNPQNTGYYKDLDVAGRTE